jgi:hypothetical protein
MPLKRHPLSANSLARTMNLAANIFDVWVFQRRPGGIVFLLLHTSVEKATRYFNGRSSRAVRALRV